MDILMSGYEWNRVSEPTIYDRCLDVVEIYGADGEPEGLELFADFETGPNTEYCSVLAYEDGSVGPGYPMGNAVDYGVVASRISWCEAMVYFGVG